RRLRIQLLLCIVAISSSSCAKHDPAAERVEGASASRECEAVTSAMNREDWRALRALAKPSARANEYIARWEKDPVRVEKLDHVERDVKLDERRCTKYSFRMQFKDGRTHPHVLEILVQEDSDQPEILDFWEFGW